MLSAGDACGHCGGKLKLLGDDVTEELEYVPNQIMVATMKDQTQSWTMRADGSYRRIAAEEDGGFSAHRHFMTNPSLSGRGSALEEPAAGPRQEPAKD